MQKGINVDVNNANSPTRTIPSSPLDLIHVSIAKYYGSIQSRLGFSRDEYTCISNPETKSYRAHILTSASYGNDGHIQIIDREPNQNHAMQKLKLKAAVSEPMLRRMSERQLGHAPNMLI